MFLSAKSTSCWLYKQAFPQHAAGLYFSSIILPNLKQQRASLTNCWTVSYNPLGLALTSEISSSPPKYTYTAPQMAGIDLSSVTDRVKITNRLTCVSGQSISISVVLAAAGWYYCSFQFADWRRRTLLTSFPQMYFRAAQVWPGLNSSHYKQLTGV